MITAVVVTYNSASRVGGCLASLLEHLPEAEIVVVDNSSSDDTERVVAATAPTARFLKLERNVGFGRACNLGLESASHEAVLFVNPDVTLKEVDGASLTSLLAERPLGLVAPALDGHPRERLFAEPLWVGDFLHHTFGILRPREWRFRLNRRRYWQKSAAWVGGAMLLVDRDEFIGLRGFDPRFFLYYEDLDISRRYRQAGLPIRATAALAGSHSGGESSTQDGLRLLPMTWSLLGWIQLLSIHEGERTARRTACSALLALRSIRFALHILRLVAPRWQRLRRKMRQIDGLFEFLHTEAEDGTDEFCPDALRILRTVGSRGASGAFT